MKTLSQISCVSRTNNSKLYNGASELTLSSQNEIHSNKSQNENEPQKQFCDACNASCCLMRHSRKLQARYEGFLLVKRINGCGASSKYLKSGRYGEQRSHNGVISLETPSVEAKQQRSHSSWELLDVGLSGNNGELSVPPRSISHVIPSDAAWEKLVNISADEDSQRFLIRKGVQLATESDSQKAFTTPALPNGKKHMCLNRTKSRSQDSLLGRRIQAPRSSEPSGEELLNNKVHNHPWNETFQQSLSRSEGSIHNVTAAECPHPPSSDTGIGTGRLWAEVEGLTKVPKRFLEKMSDEVGQIVFYLERWREEYVVLKNTGITLRSSNGGDIVVLPYSQMMEVRPVTQIGLSGQQHCLLIVCRKTSLLMQASTSYVRDQWLHTLIWKRNSHKYRNLLKTATRPEVLLKGLKSLVDLSLSTPLHDQSVCQVPLELTSSLLTHNDWLNRTTNEQIIVTLAPLLENNRPSAEICSFFSRHCSDNPRSSLVIDMFTPVVKRILKHNVDFCTYPYVRRFTQDYIQALNSQNNGLSVVHKFVRDIHGTASCCPHLRVLPNLVSVCTSAICFILDIVQNKQSSINIYDEQDPSFHLECYVSTIGVISEYDDWRPGLALLLQPIPFPEYAFDNEIFLRGILSVIESIGTDPRCQVHQAMLAPRENKDGWVQLISPSYLNGQEKGEIWISILGVLLSCCYRRKKFLKMLLKSIGSCLLFALRDNVTAQEILCLMLEWQLIEDKDQILQIVSTLQSTDSGKRKYQILFDRQIHLSELQQKSGPWKLSLPARSDDEDVCRLLSSGPFGNLEVLSLSFTRVTSNCAEQLIQLPSLKHLDLWSTQFGDKGLQLICEHLHDLEVLNLCETPVTDVGLAALATLKRLRKLNLNSTKVSLQMFEQLKDSLLNLEEIDLRYTDAW